ncbi:MAG TPA: hypothetical protein VK395_22330 [Gemmataceae bacterium]|nr:hypothetical protein [Gemmataceae bacterium]
MNQRGNLITWLVILSFTVVMIAYDVLAYALWGVDATISRRVLFASQGTPLIAFAVGVLCGHLFWPQRPSSKE